MWLDSSNIFQRCGKQKTFQAIDIINIIESKVGLSRRK